MTGHTLTVLAQTFTEQLPACLFGGTAIVIFAWMLLRITGRQNPGTRFAVWLCVLFAVAALLVTGRYEPGASASIASSALPMHGAIQLPRAWALYMFAAWATIASIALLRVGVGLWRVGRLRNQCEELDIERWDPSFRDSLNGVQSRRQFSLCVSESVCVPTAIGFFGPAVVIPRWLIQELSPADLRQVVLHEVAHLERWDDWTNLAQKVLRALLFFHPAAWWIEKRLTLEREMACDDVVLRQTANPRAYAQCLALLAEKNFARRSMALAQAAVTRIRQTSLRVSRILHINTPVKAGVWKPALSLFAVLSFAGACSQLSLPKFVTFEDTAAEITPIATVAKPPIIETAAISPAIQKPNAARNARVNHSAEQVAKAAISERLPGVVDARYRMQEPGEYKPVLAHAKAPAVLSEGAVVEQAVFVVMHSDRGDEHTVAVWQVTVWHVAVTPENNPARNEITNKKI